MMPQTYGNGVLVAGDAGGFLLNNGYTFRGVDLAIASGMAAADAYHAARQAGNFSASSLRGYVERLRDHSVLDDLLTFRKAPNYLKNARLYSDYPRLLCDFMETLYTIDGKPKDRVALTFLKEAARKVSIPGAVVDLVRGSLVM